MGGVDIPVQRSSRKEVKREKRERERENDGSAVREEGKKEKKTGGTTLDVGQCLLFSFLFLFHFFSLKGGGEKCSTPTQLLIEI